ncbi:hypothetical protein BST61_g9163 [Cercospora zeina]
MATEFITSVRETDVGILLDILHARLNEAHITTLNELLACWSTWLTDPPLHFARVSQLACNSYFRSLLARAANAELPLAEMVRVPTHLNPLASYLVAIYDVRFGFIFPSASIRARSSSQASPFQYVCRFPKDGEIKDEGHYVRRDGQGSSVTIGGCMPSLGHTAHDRC